MTAEKMPRKQRKLVVSLLLGALVGLAGMKGITYLLQSGLLGNPGPSEAIAVVMGSVYLIIAALIGAGLPSPALGAKYLNLEDADELRQQRKVLAYSAAATAAMGGALVVLALAGPGGILLPSTALAGALALFAVSIVLGVVQWRHLDELMRSVSAECGNIGFYLLLVFGGGWTMLAHLGYVAAPSPLDWLTIFYFFLLLASFIGTGRRGLLKPR